MMPPRVLASGPKPCGGNNPKVGMWKPIFILRIKINLPGINFLQPFFPNKKNEKSHNLTITCPNERPTKG